MLSFIKYILQLINLEGMHIPEYVWRSEDTLWKLVLSFYCVCPRDLIRLSGLVTGAFTCRAVKNSFMKFLTIVWMCPILFFKKKKSEQFLNFKDALLFLTKNILVCLYPCESCMCDVCLWAHMLQLGDQRTAWWSWFSLPLLCGNWDRVSCGSDWPGTH